MFGAQVKGIRGADGVVKTLKDVGEYDVWTHIIVSSGQQGELLGFTYQVGGIVSGTAGVNATKLDTNMRVASQFVDESMSVYAIAIQIERLTRAVFQDLSIVPPEVAPGSKKPFQATYRDFKEMEAHTLFRMHVGGDKPFSEGMLTWFAESGGLYGSTAQSGESIIANNVPTIASARKWEFKLPIGRIEKFWCELIWPQGSPTFSVFPDSAPAVPGRVGVYVRLLGVRARGVQ
jgi:hypothetical protein